MALATALALAGVAAEGAGTVNSFVQAGKQRNLQKEAQAQADAAMAEARKRLEVNYFDALGVKKEPYELQREADLSQGAQAIQAGAEDPRGVGAVAGRVQAAQNVAQEGIRSSEGQDMTNLQKLQLQEDSRLRDVNTQLDLGEVHGAQLAARDAQVAAANYNNQGWAGVTAMGKSALQLVPLYGGGGGGDMSGVGGGGGATTGGSAGSVNNAQAVPPASDYIPNNSSGQSPDMINAPSLNFRPPMMPQDPYSGYNPFVIDYLHPH